MTRLMDPTGRLAFTADFKRQVSIDQAWVKTQTKSKPNMRPVGMQQTERTVMLCSSENTREVHSSYI